MINLYLLHCLYRNTKLVFKRGIEDIKLLKLKKIWATLLHYFNVCNKI